MKNCRYLAVGFLISLLGTPAVAELAALPDSAVCSNAVRNGQWETSSGKIIYVEEARARNLNCGIKTGVSKVEYSNGYAQASLRCGKAPNGKRGWSATLDGYANPHGFILYRNWISGKGEIGYTFLEARRNRGFGSKGGFLITGTGVRESGNSWNFKFNMPPDTDLLTALKTGIEGFENPSSNNWKRKCTLKAYSLYRPVNPEMVNSLRENITELRAKAQNERQKAQSLEADNKAIAVKLSELEKQQAEYNEATLKLLDDVQKFQSGNVELQTLNQELESKLSEALNQVAKQKQSNKTKEQLAKKNEIVAKLTKQLEETKKALGDQRKKLDAQLKKVENENQSLTKSLSTMEETHKAEMVALKKLIPDESLQNQKLTKIASNASQKNSVMTSGSPSSASTQNLRMTFEARLLEKSKEFGDGFTNYVAGLNKTLLAIEITNAQFKSDSQMQLDQLEYVLLDEGKPAISASTEAYEAAMAQGLRISNEEASLRVFEVSMSLKTDSLKILAIDGASIFGESKLN